MAHELGHAMHSVYTNRAQPYHYSGHSIFTAEVASTANEWLMLDYLYKQAKTKEENSACSSNKSSKSAARCTRK